MKKFIFLLIISLSFQISSFGAESEIILINSSAFVVELNENYDVVKIIKELPNYFSEDATHEELLDAYVSTKSKVEDETIGSVTPKECRTKSIVEVSTSKQQPNTYFCSQLFDNQSVVSLSMGLQTPGLGNNLFVHPKKGAKPYFFREGCVYENFPISFV